MIYVIAESAAGPCKIGIGHPESRLAGLQVGNPRALSLVHRTRPPDGVAEIKVERFAHRVAAARHLRGEWFDLTVAEAIEAVTLAVTVFGGLPEPLPLSAWIGLPEQPERPEFRDVPAHLADLIIRHPLARP